MKEMKFGCREMVWTACWWMALSRKQEKLLATTIMTLNFYEVQFMRRERTVDGREEPEWIYKFPFSSLHLSKKKWEDRWEDKEKYDKDGSLARCAVTAIASAIAASYGWWWLFTYWWGGKKLWTAMLNFCDIAFEGFWRKRKEIRGRDGLIKKCDLLAPQLSILIFHIFLIELHLFIFFADNDHIRPLPFLSHSPLFSPYHFIPPSYSSLSITRLV